MSALPATQWTARQREIAKTSDPYALRDCRIYLIITRDPWAGVPGRLGDLIVGYIGETWRTPAERLAEHLKDQWWSRDIVMVVAFPNVCRNKAEAWELERQLVNLFETPYNKEYNGSSRWLIVDGRAVHRNDLPAQPDWWPTGDSRVSALGSGAPTWLELWWARRRWWVIGLSAVWLAMFAGATRLAAYQWDGSDAAVAGAIGTSVPFVVVRIEIWRRQVRAWWRRLRRRHRRGR